MPSQSVLKTKLWTTLLGQTTLSNGRSSHYLAEDPLYAQEKNLSNPEAGLTQDHPCIPM